MKLIFNRHGHLLPVVQIIFAALCLGEGTAAAQESGHTRDVLSLNFSPDGKLLATASDDDTVKLWSWPELKPVATLRGHSTATAVRFSPDGTRLATSGADETVRLWDVAKRQQIRMIKAYSRGALAFSPNGELLAIGNGSDNAVLVVDGRDLTRRYEFFPSGDRSNGGYVAALAFSPDGKSIIAAGYRESIVHLFDAATGEKKIWESDLPAPRGRYAVNGAAFSPDGSLLVVAAGGGCDANGEATLWRLPAGELVGRLLVKEQHRWVNSVDFSPDGRLVVGGVDDNTVRLWEVSSLSLALTLTGAQGDVRAVAFTRDGNGIAATSGSNIITWKLTEH